MIFSFHQSVAQIATDVDQQSFASRCENRADSLGQILQLKEGLVATTAVPKIVGIVRSIQGEPKVEGRARLVGQHPLKAGDFIFENDVIRTSSEQRVSLSMTDGATLDLGPNSIIETASAMSPIILTKGTTRFASGKGTKSTAKRISVRTPSAQLGVRGTVHEMFVDPNGTRDRVFEGATFLRNKWGKVEISAGQTGYAPLRGAPRLLP